MRRLTVAGCALVLTLALLQSGCAGPASPRRLNVFAAASLAGPVNEIAGRFSANNPGVAITPAFAGSQILRAQLSQGARADVLAVASARDMEMARQLKLLVGEPRTFARNTIAIVTPARGRAQVQRWPDLARKGIRLAMAGPAVPAGFYARNVIGRLGGLPEAGTGFADAVLANVVSEDEEVTHVLAKVVLGEVDAGFVYASDARTRQLVTVDIPAELNEEVVYSAAVVAGSAEPALAGMFVEALLGPGGQGVLAKYGFLPVGPGPAPTVR